MNLTPEQQTVGRRNFLKAVAGVPALAGLGVAAAVKGPVRGGPLRIGFIGVGGEGRVLLGEVDPQFGTVLAMADINPTQLAKADEVLQKRSLPAASTTPNGATCSRTRTSRPSSSPCRLWAHADVTVGCLEAGKHVLCEKMMAWDIAGCERMRSAAVATNKQVLEIGYQRNYNPMYQAAYEGIIKTGMLGDVYYVAHRLASQRQLAPKGKPPSPDYNPSKWGYPTFEHLLNWRLYKRYSRGLLAELASHQVNIVNWFFGAEPVATMGTGGVYRFNDGQREIGDHVYTTLEYPGGRTAVFSSVESNAWDHYYEAFFGTKGTLVLQGEAEAFLFDEGTGQPAARVSK